MSDSLNNKELIAVGHEFARTMGSDTPIIDMARIVTRLAERLDSATNALGEMTKQRDAHVQAERVWETAMMQACGEDGPKSVADKFSALEAKCAALAAENAALKEVVSGVTSELYGQGFEVAGWHLNGALEPLDNCFTDNGWEMPETPSTDTFLAEVRAQLWIEGNEPEEFGRYWVSYETDFGPQYCSARWMEYNFCAGSDNNIHKIWLADHSRSINPLRGVTHYTKLPDSLEGAAQ